MGESKELRGGVMVIDQLRGGKAFSSKDMRVVPEVYARQHNTSDSTYDVVLRKRKENSVKASEFGGKRFLGLTPKGKQVFVKYKLTKDDMKLKISFSHKPSILLKEGSKLANNRYDCGLNETLKNSPEQMTRKLQKPHSQQVTEQTLYWIKRLQLLTEMNYKSGFVKDKPTKSMFHNVIGVIYTGNWDTSSVKPTTREILDNWNFPEGGEYFLPENTWSYPDEL